MKKVLGAAVVSIPLLVIFAQTAVTSSFKHALILYGQLGILVIFTLACVIAGLMLIKGGE